MYDKLFSRIDKAKVVSFDIFDTLLKRNVARPSDVFRIVAQRFCEQSGRSFDNFSSLRHQAELEARQASPLEDVTLEQVYQALHADEADKVLLMALELDTERAVLTVNHDIKPFYDYALQKGKDVVIVSDMYLGADFLADVLAANGYVGHKALYVSSEYGKTKASGNLFRVMLEHNHYAPADVLHVGDALKSDCVRPMLLGLKTFHIPRFVSRSLYNLCQPQSADVSQGVISHFVNNHVCGNRFERIGFETLGPLLYGFCTWLHQQKVAKGLDKLLFFSRDGQIAFRLYQQMFPDDDVEYVYFSRRSLTVPLLCKLSSFADVLDTIPVPRYTDVETFISRLGLCYDNHSAVIQSFGLSRNQLVHRSELSSNPVFANLYEALKPEVLKVSQFEYECLLQYIGSLNCNGCMGIVDIGWAGTIQKALHKLFAVAQMPMRVEGFYLGILAEGDNYHGYLFEPGHDQLRFPVMSFAGLMETMFSADHGSVRSYDHDGATFQDFEYNLDDKARSEFQAIQQLQNGALDMALQFFRSSSSSFCSVSPSLAFDALGRFGTEPLLLDAKTFGNFYFFDNKILSLAKPQFTFSPKKAMGDFSLASWKIAYLKRILRLKLPYLKIYNFLRSSAS